MNDYRMFKSRNGYVALRHKHNRNDCILMHNGFVMAKDGYHIIDRLFFQFANKLE